MPLVAVSLHSGHSLREEVANAQHISGMDRLREEDPGTETWTDIGGVQIAVDRSRFEVDLNRPRETAVYLSPQQSWGIEVWKGGNAPPEIAERSREIHDAFYRDFGQCLHRLEREHGAFIVLDLHSYNHRRCGPDAPFDPAAENPDLNLGTGSMPRARWAPVVQAFMSSLRRTPVGGRTLDVRENIRFFGGYLSRFVHETFPTTGCALAIEFKKFFMNEWSGEIDERILMDIRSALEQSIPEMLRALERCSGKA